MPPVKVLLLENIHPEGVSLLTERGFEVPTGEGIRLHHLLTVNLDAGAIEHVVNEVGARVDSSAPGVPSYVVDYPTR